MYTEPTHGNNAKPIPTEAFARTYEGKIYRAARRSDKTTPEAQLSANIAAQHIDAFKTAGGSDYFIEPNDPSLEHCIPVCVKEIEDIRMLVGANAPLDSILTNGQTTTFEVRKSPRNSSVLLATNLQPRV